MDLYKDILRPILFKIDPELIHDLSINSLKFLDNFDFKQEFCYQEKFKKQLFDLSFPNRVGLAAGFDKNAHLLGVANLLGFGFIEIGTITPKPQPGNPRPRLFRFPNDETILNFMGFNNDGVEVINKRLEKRKNSNIIVGANIGKNKYTDINEAYKDYTYCVKELYSNIDYFTLNVSSPNTIGLRNLLDLEPLKFLLDSVQNQNRSNHITRPVLVKISPDLTDEQTIGVIDLCLEYDIKGIISTNTTTNHQYFKGGISGRLLKDRSLNVLKLIKNHIGDRLSIISTGGIMDDSDAIDRFDEGADLIQLYTGLVYEGPLLPRKILKKYELRHPTKED